MTLDQAIRQVETARAELAAAAERASTWSDGLRRTFDRQRMAPLDAAAGRMLTALRAAQEQCARAERLLAAP